MMLSVANRTRPVRLLDLSQRARWPGRLASAFLACAAPTASLPAHAQPSQPSVAETALDMPAAEAGAAPSPPSAFYQTPEQAAQQPPSADPLAMPEPDPSEQWAKLDPRREGAGVASVTGEVALLDPSAASSHRRVAGAGFSFQVVGRRKN